MEMQSIEEVQVRLFDVNDGDIVIDAFKQLPQKGQLFQAGLYQSDTVANDWSIFFWKSNAKGIDAKCAEAIYLAESLRQIGLVHHSVWRLQPTPAHVSQMRLERKQQPSSRKAPQLRRTSS